MDITYTFDDNLDEATKAEAMNVAQEAIAAITKGRFKAKTTITFTLDDNLGDAVMARAMNSSWAIIAAMTEDRFEYKQDGGPKLAQFANDVWNKWSKFPWE